MKKSLVALAALAVVGAAHAQLSANVALTSSYKFRGQDQSDNRPAIQGGFDWTAGGFYAGNWNSSIGFTDAGIESDLYAGYRGDAGGLAYDVGVIGYLYPRFGDGNTVEVYGGVTFGMFTAKYSHTVSKGYFGLAGDQEGRGTGYLSLAAAVPVSDAVTIDLGVGYTRLSSDLKNAIGLPSFYDYKVGASTMLPGDFKLGAAVVGATKDGANQWGDVNKARFIVTLSKSL